MTDLTMQVSDALDALCREPDEREWGPKGWTRRVKSAVINLAKDAGHRTYASGVPGADGAEWSTT